MKWLLVCLVVAGLLISGCRQTENKQPTPPQTPATSPVGSESPTNASDRLAAAVEAGTITKEQADRLRERIAQGGGMPGAAGSRPSGQGQGTAGNASGAIESSSPGGNGQEGQSSSPSPATINWEEARTHIGEEVTVCGPVAGAQYESSSPDRPTYLQIGGQSSDPQRLEVVIWGRDRTRFPQPPEKYYLGKTVCITGSIQMEAGVLRMTLTSRTAITEK